jgi:hypothetical protein
MSEIYFCDVCNESVPVVDLEQGRALRVKERVVCAVCNRAMGGSLATGTESASSSGHAATAAPSPAVPIHSHGHAYTATHHPPSGAGAALALGALGLGIAVSVGVWARGELEAFRVAAAADSERTMVVQREFAARLEASEIEERSRRELSASEAREEWMNLRAEVAELRTRGDSGLADLSAKLAEASQRMAALDLSLASVARHDAELVSVQQKLVELRAAVDALSTELSTKLAEVRRAGGGAGSAAETEDPAWLALLEQLRSANVSERYVALVGLASSRDPRATAEVLPSLKDADIFLRMAAARALGDLASRDAISALMEALVREAAYLSLRSITQRDLPFDAHSPDAAERAKRIKTWREWWEKERPKAG